MLNAPITPSLMAEMLFDRGIRLAEILDAGALTDRMAEALVMYRVSPACAPTDHAAVRADLDRLWNGERPTGKAAA